MPTIRLYAVVTATGTRHHLLTLHPDGTLSAETEDMAAALSNFRRRGFSNRTILDYTIRGSNGYVTYVEEVEDD